jgi:hypothetical protein
LWFFFRLVAEQLGLRNSLEEKERISNETERLNSIELQRQELRIVELEEAKRLMKIEVINKKALYEAEKRRREDGVN